MADKKFTRRRLVQYTGAAALTPLLPAFKAGADQVTEPKNNPGVYVAEGNAFSKSFPPAATAVPVFIGYTETAMNGDEPLISVPWRISSLAEYHQYFGGAPQPVFDIEEVSDPTNTGAVLDDTKTDPMPDVRFSLGTGPFQTEYKLKQVNTAYALYAAMRLFFQNGGGACYIMSVASYSYKTRQGDDVEIDAGIMMRSLDHLTKWPEPTLVVIPETTRMTRQRSIAVQQSMLAHCGEYMKNRFAILDVFAGHLDQQDPRGNPIKSFRDEIGVSNLDYGAAYYPWVNTTIFQTGDFTYENLTVNALQLMETYITSAEEALITPEEKALKPGETAEAADARLAQKYPQRAEIAKVTIADVSGLDENTTDATLRTKVPIYKQVMGKIADFVNCMPPASGMAGIYTTVDATKAVWEAPANTTFNSVVSTSVNVSSDEQEGLHVHPTGKSINALRPFVGEGVRVWGARTLDGKSLNYQYISVRRTMIFIEESIKLGLKDYAFEPNTASTWNTISSAIENFLTGIWKQGGLQGIKPEEAFNVNIGLGKTMTPTDILEGIMRVEVRVALLLPAEFNEIQIELEMVAS